MLVYFLVKSHLSSIPIRTELFLAEERLIRTDDEDFLEESVTDPETQSVISSQRKETDEKSFPVLKTFKYHISL